MQVLIILVLVYASSAVPYGKGGIGAGSWDSTTGRGISGAAQNVGRQVDASGISNDIGRLVGTLGGSLASTAAGLTASLGSLASAVGRSTGSLGSAGPLSTGTVRFGGPLGSGGSLSAGPLGSAGPLSTGTVRFAGPIGSGGSLSAGPLGSTGPLSTGTVSFAGPLGSDGSLSAGPIGSTSGSGTTSSQVGGYIVISYATYIRIISYIAALERAISISGAGIGGLAGSVGSTSSGQAQLGPIIGGRSSIVSFQPTGLASGQFSVPTNGRLSSVGGDVSGGVPSLRGIISNLGGLSGLRGVSSLGGSGGLGVSGSGDATGISGLRGFAGIGGTDASGLSGFAGTRRFGAPRSGDSGFTDVRRIGDNGLVASFGLSRGLGSAANLRGGLGGSGMDSVAVGSINRGTVGSVNRGNTSGRAGKGTY